MLIHIDSQINQLLFENQYGFWQATSTSDAINAVTDYVVASSDDRKKCLAIFLALAKAFDTISVSILLHKLETIGIKY